MRRFSLGFILVMFAVAVAAILAPGAARAGGGCGEPSTDVRGTAVDLKELCILPTVIRADVGQTITWTNRDALPHTVTGAGLRSGDGNGWGTLDNIAQGQTFSHAFDRAGVYPYFCWLHPGMVGAVVVGDGNAAAYPATMGGALPARPQPQARAGTHTSARSMTLAALAVAGVVLVGGASYATASVRRRGERP
jgi:plastocyanin